MIVIQSTGHGVDSPVIAPGMEHVGLTAEKMTTNLLITHACRLSHQLIVGKHGHHLVLQFVDTFVDLRQRALIKEKDREADKQTGHYCRCQQRLFLA